MGALSSLMASYGDDSDEEDEAAAAEKQDEVEVSPRQLASEILEGLVATAFRGESRPDAFTAAQEPSFSGSEEEGESDSDDSGNEVRRAMVSMFSKELA